MVSVQVHYVTANGVRKGLTPTPVHSPLTPPRDLADLCRAGAITRVKGQGPLEWTE